MFDQEIDEKHPKKLHFSFLKEYPNGEIRAILTKKDRRGLPSHLRMVVTIGFYRKPKKKSRQWKRI